MPTDSSASSIIPNFIIHHPSLDLVTKIGVINTHKLPISNWEYIHNQRGTEKKRMQTSTAENGKWARHIPLANSGNPIKFPQSTTVWKPLVASPNKSTSIAFSPQDRMLIWGHKIWKKNGTHLTNLTPLVPYFSPLPPKAEPADGNSIP
eukprot:TRINITY_DN498_c1_g1_i1.p1 TRINITY_DN498_c1_g1~~TRINITY_DN498_c1_g1_i1.p1  ORF type:complete len:149 (+),score=25.85 TRINITY_DN498_c1_g1_i1:340-786(+)